MQVSRKLALGATLLAAVSFSPVMAIAADSTMQATQMNTAKMSTAKMAGPDTMLERLSKKLDLTTEQKKQIKEIMTKNADQMQAYSQEVMKNKADMRTLTHSSDYSVDKAQAIADKQSATMNKMIMLRAEQKNAVWTALTPEQQQKMQKMAQNYKTKMGK